jgi:hypothetical protein
MNIPRTTMGTRPPNTVHKQHPAPVSNRNGPAHISSGIGNEPYKVFVSKIDKDAPQSLLKRVLEQCGRVVKWTQLSVFGFCEFAGAEAAMRALRILKDVAINGQHLVATIDDKTKQRIEQHKTASLTPAQRATGVQYQEDTKHDNGVIIVIKKMVEEYHKNNSKMQAISDANDAAAIAAAESKSVSGITSQVSPVTDRDGHVIVTLPDGTTATASASASAKQTGDNSHSGHETSRSSKRQHISADTASVSKDTRVADQALQPAEKKVRLSQLTPTADDSVFTASVQWTTVNQPQWLETNIKPVINDLMMDYFGDQEDDVIAFILDLLRSQKSAKQFETEIANVVLPEDAHDLTLKIWQKLIG